LLNFILPDIFDDLDSFQQWFNFDDMHTGGDSAFLNKSSVVTSLHAILKPFLLRRLKVDVEKDLPPKKEYLLYAPLTQQQKDIYQAIVSRQIRQYLVDKKSHQGEGEEEEEEEVKPETVEPEHDGRRSRKQQRVNYKIEENDSKYIRDLENGDEPDEPNGVKEKSAAEVGKEWAMKQASECRSHSPTDDSEKRQQHETPEHDHATAQDLLSSLPVRLAYRPRHKSACGQR